VFHSEWATFKWGIDEEAIKMRIIMDRGYCDASRSFCARCSATFFRKPMGTDRPCVVDVIDDGDDDLLHFELRTSGQTLTFDLTQELQEGLALEGWEFLAAFYPSYLRSGAAERWRALSTLPPHDSHTAASPGHI
jgi:hypothetical protein